MPKSSHLQQLLLVALLLVTSVVFMPSLSGGWLGDDNHLVVEADCNHGIEHIPDIVRQQSGRCDYRPLRHISYAVDYSLWGLNPFGYHLTNLILHLMAVFLAYLIFMRLGLSGLFAPVGAAIFALHPVQMDAVGYISGRRDVLMGLGYLIAFFGALRFSEFAATPETRKARLKWASVILLGSIISVTSKEMGATIIATVGLFFLFGGQAAFANASAPQKSLLSRVWERRWLLLALGIPSALILVWRGLLHPVSTVAHSLFGGTLARHIATILAVHGRYVELIFFPMRLSGDYAPPVIHVPDSLFALPALFGALWLTLLVGLALYFYRKHRRRASFGISWYLVTMLPVSHLIPHHELAAEHYLYIPLLGLALCTADLLQHLWEKIDPHATESNKAQMAARRRIMLFLISLVLILLAARSFNRAFDYQSEAAHAGATVKYFPTSVRGQARLGLALLADDNFEEARPHIEYVLGTSFQGSARQDVLRILGEYFVEHAQYKKSLKLLEEFLSLRPSNKSATVALSKAYFELGAMQKAYKLNQQLVAQTPNSAEFRYKLALTAFMLKHRDIAREQALNALKFEPDHLDSLLLAANLTMENDRSKALKLLDRAESALAQDSAEQRVPHEKLLRRLRDKIGYGHDEQ